MDIHDIQTLYGRLPQAGALVKYLEDASVKSVFLKDIVGSALPTLFAGIAPRLDNTFLFVMQDADEAGYFYNDLLPAVLNTAEKKVAEEIKAEQQKNTSKDSQTDTDSSQPADYDVYYFPSSYRRAVKYGQRDAANEILRTEVLAQIAARQQHTTHEKPLFVVTYPEAMAELVVSQKHIDDHRLSLSVGQRIDIVEVEHRLRDLGPRCLFLFQRVAVPYRLLWRRDRHHPVFLR